MIEKRSRRAGNDPLPGAFFSEGKTVMLPLAFFCRSVLDFFDKMHFEISKKYLTKQKLCAILYYNKPLKRR